MIRLVFLLAVALLAAPAQAQLYKWKDANGHVQYSDKPPPGGQPAKTVALPGVSGKAATTAGGAAATAGPQSTAEREQDYQKRRVEQAEAQKKADQLAQEKRASEENCRNARMNLTGLESGQRQVRVDADGERRFLEASEIDQETARAREAVARFCK